MTRLYRIEVYDALDANGVSTRQSEGTPVEVNGRQMVALYHGAIIPRGDDWCETLADARHKAADQIEEIAARITRQAFRVREGVTHESN